MAKEKNMPDYIYLRLFGYTVTLIMHLTNILAMAKHTEEFKEDLLKDPRAHDFAMMQSRYFTIWNFFLQIIYSVLGLTCDLLTLKNSRQRDYQLPKYLRGHRDRLFAAVLWPSTFVVFTVFWGFYHYDRDLMFPEFMEKALTNTSNHVVHTAIVPVVLWEAMFRARPPPRSHWKNMMYLLFHLILYFSVLVYTYMERGVWVYPVFTKAYGTIHFPIIIASMVLLFYVFYFLQWVVNYLRWGDVKLSKKLR